MARAITIPQPPLSNAGFPAGPHLYPRLLRRIADALDALNAIGHEDPALHESPHYAVGHAIAIFDEDAEDDTDPDAALVGWLDLIDHNCWVFVPYIDALDLEKCAQPLRRLHPPRAPRVKR